MPVTARLLPLLLIAVALTLPASARTVMRVDVHINASAVFGQSATPSNAQRMAMACRDCNVKTCGVYCATANALLPLTIVLAAITPQPAVPSVILAVRDRRGPPDPYPPRPLTIS